MQKLPALGKWSLFWTIFIGLGAVAGSLMMWLMPGWFGEAMLVPLRRLPLGHLIGTSYALPGLALLCAIGLPHLIAAWLIHKRTPAGPVVALTAGIILLAWLTLQLFYLFGPNPITNIYTAFALIETVTAALWLKSSKKPVTSR
jgi:hypothetical protein